MNSKHTWLNDNDLVVGATGSGKTTSIIIPAIRKTDKSLICTDTKGNLYINNADDLRRRGFEVYLLDLSDPAKSLTSYNPLDYIGRYKVGRRTVWNEKDIISLSATLSPTQTCEDIFWDDMARNIVQMLTAYVLEAFGEKERNLATVSDVFKLLSYEMSGQKKRCSFLEEHSLLHPESFAVRKYQMLRNSAHADRTWACIEAFTANVLALYDFDGTRSMITKPSGFRIEDLGKKKCALFVNVSDNDASLRPLVSTFFTQCFQTLLREADSRPDSRLEVPVRILLDDYGASSGVIPDFDRIISVIRSRGISTTVILQNLSQLESIYGAARSATVISNCDRLRFLGSSDLATVSYMSKRFNKPFNQLMELPLDKAYSLVRGQKAQLLTKRLPAAPSEAEGGCDVSECAPDRQPA